ncbi:hypothetical protein CEXT_492801 [Caerostris extrusa]|uniref:Uncharacterized protein n=1 Tax=Caerostris extrusa TaxID=172846 RepID=A0AAV4RZ12_CAEEX|nr:hypothetical protein CEXT_492801 [Caerostris extrusa]
MRIIRCEGDIGPISRIEKDILIDGKAEEKFFYRCKSSSPGMERKCSHVRLTFTVLLWFWILDALVMSNRAVYVGDRHGECGVSP